MPATPEATAPQSEDVQQESKKVPRGPRGGNITKRNKGDPPRKRGPPRPHRKLAQDVLEGRIAKLRKRIDRAKGQLEDAERHIDGYAKEAKYREADSKQE